MEDIVSLFGEMKDSICDFLFELNVFKKLFKDDPRLAEVEMKALQLQKMVQDFEPFPKLK